MKTVVQVQEFGGKPVVFLDYTNRLFFAGAGPAPEDLITLEIPGSGKLTFPRLQRWLEEHAGKQREQRRRREVSLIPEESWRRAALDDFVDSEDQHGALYSASGFFSPEEFHAFGTRWLAETQSRLGEALAISAAAERVARLGQVQPLLERVYAVLECCPDALELERNRYEEQTDRLAWTAAQAAGENLADWIDAAARLRHPELQEEATLAIAEAIATRDDIDGEACGHLLARLYRKRKLREQTQYDPGFWKAIARKAQLTAPVTGQTVDLTTAHEVRVQLNWDILSAKRIGPVTPGRTALVVVDDRGRVRYLVHGERKLKFRIAAAGGSLRKYGCTLTLRGQQGSSSLQPILMEVERLDTLAHLDPDQAVAIVADLNLPAEHSVYRVAAAAGTDARSGRMLADLLIELKWGIDADVARHLSRAEARANRF
jgi:hypothetical protein